MRFAGARVLVTGATGGIGQSIATRLAAQGARLVLTGRRADMLARLADKLSGEPIAADLADAADVQRLVDQCARIDVVIANAALPGSGRVLDYTEAQLDRSFEVNLLAPVKLARALAPAMIGSGRGHIVMVGSISGKVASASTALYNAAKFGLRGFAHGFRAELHGTGVGVSIVQPGFVRDAGMFAATGVTLPAIARTVAPERVAAAVVRAVERDIAEINVAPLELRAFSAIAGQFPTLGARLQRWAGGDTIAEKIIDAQRGQR
ncbi:SDR family NAD(P)-dependent oxidoreductase [Actinokineospora sp. HUAS TT18]|uniref:SDR family NAD(P)-dependent oxidoreductase n=1 Tax=Actinokineospora sp. HUAS TT18 TaxID=3447451 RepID=UPI003F52200E